MVSAQWQKTKAARWEQDEIDMAQRIYERTVADYNLFRTVHGHEAHFQQMAQWSIGVAHAWYLAVGAAKQLEETEQ